MSDIFHEVDEEVQARAAAAALGTPRQPHRRARAAGRARRSVAGAATTGGRTRRRPNRARRSRRRSRSPKPASRPRRRPRSASSPRRAVPATASLARFREAAELAKTDPAAAVKAYDSLAADRQLGRTPAGPRDDSRRADPGRYRARSPNSPRSSSRSPRPTVRSATPRANCSRSAHGAPAMRRPPSAGST